MMKKLMQRKQTAIITLKARYNCLIQDANLELPAQLELRLF